MTKDYIKELRQKVGHDPVILTFAGGVLVNSNNEILLQKRSDFNCWGLPGGALEFGESAEDACKREFREEAGLEVTVKTLLGVSTNQIQHYPNGDIAQAVVISFVVEKAREVTQELSSETLDLKYFKSTELPPIFNQQHQTIIEQFYAGTFPFYN